MKFQKIQIEKNINSHSFGNKICNIKNNTMKIKISNNLLLSNFKKLFTLVTAALFFYIYLLLSESIFVKAFDINSEDSMRQITVLACAAIAKKMVETPSENKKFEETSKKFSTRINYEIDQTKNFVNLLLLNNCYKKLDMEIASQVIKERAESKDVNTKYIHYLNLDGVYNDYNSLDNEEKKNLFQELAEIKEHLKGLSDNLNDLSKGTGSEQQTQKSPNQKKKTQKSETKDGSNENSNQQGFITLMIELFKFTLSNIFSFVFENIYIVGLAVVLALMFSLFGKKRVRKIKKTTLNTDKAE